MKKKFLKNFVLLSCLTGSSVTGALQLTSCSCKEIEPTVTLNDDHCKKANSNGVVFFKFTSNFKPTNELFNFRLLNYSEDSIELKQTTSIVSPIASAHYDFTIVLQIKTNDIHSIIFDLEITSEINNQNFKQVIEKLEVIRDIDPSFISNNTNFPRREVLFNEDKIAEFPFVFAIQTDDKKVKFELCDNDKLLLCNDGIVEIDGSPLKGILKVKLSSDQFSEETEYLFNLKISFKVEDLQYEYFYQDFKCIYKVDKINFISNNTFDDILSIDESVNYKFSFLHNPSDNKCNVSITSEDNVIGFTNGRTSSSININDETRLCEFSLKILKNVDLYDKYSVDIPFNLKFTFNSSVFNKETIVEYNQLVIRLINTNASSIFKYNGEYTKNVANYEHFLIEYDEFVLNSELSFDPSFAMPIEINSYEVIGGNDGYIESLQFSKISDNRYKLVLLPNNNLLKNDKVESFVFKTNTTIHFIDKSGKQTAGNIDFENFKVKFDVIKEIPSNLLQINDDKITGINTSFDLSGYDTLIIPSNVITITENAFKNKLPSNITNLIFADGAQIQHINESAFEGCNSLSCELKLPETLYVIGKNAFKNCSGLIGEIKIPNRVVNLGIGAFEGCSNLTSLKLGTGAGIINSNCFKDCINLSGDLVIHSYISQINDSAFENCVSLSKLIFEKDETTLPKISQIWNKAFYNCKNISLVDQFPTSITLIGKNCFQGCFNLAHELVDGAITINEGCSIDECSFSGCNSIKEVSLMNYCTIGNSAFTNCLDIEKLFIAKDVNKYNWTEAFFNCLNLKIIDLSEFVSVPWSWEFGNSSETFSNCASNGEIIVANEEIGIKLLEFMQSKGIGFGWTYTVKDM